MFGESGSGKTVMLSSFYGATQESQYLQKSLFHVVPDDIGQSGGLNFAYPNRPCLNDNEQCHAVTLPHGLVAYSGSAHSVQFDDACK